MDRRKFVSQTSIAAAVALFGARSASGAGQSAHLDAVTLKPLPRREQVRVAFLLGESANVIDTAGPWEVFQDVMLHDAKHVHPFELYTVAPQAGVLKMTGGLQVQPDYTLRDAPAPHVIVVPAHRGSEASLAWLREASATADVTMSICTGAFQLARAGLLKDVAATTHHQLWDAFAKEFPDIELRRGLRFVDNGRIATSGGLTSGIDLALHVVARYFGAEAAENTARYMEHQGDGWRV